MSLDCLASRCSRSETCLDYRWRHFLQSPPQLREHAVARAMIVCTRVHYACSGTHGASAPPGFPRISVGVRSRKRDEDRAAPDVPCRQLRRHRRCGLRDGRWVRRAPCCTCDAARVVLLGAFARLFRATDGLGSCLAFGQCRPARVGRGSAPDVARLARDIPSCRDRELRQ